MKQYIKINDDNSVRLLGSELFDVNIEYDVLYTGHIPNGDFLIWDEASNTILEDSETRKQKELSNIRDARDQLLKDTDWVIIKSLEGGDIDPEWIEYRQELRDLPSQYNLTGLIDFPDPPVSGLHDNIQPENLQPHTIRLINPEDSVNKELENWGWGVDEDEDYVSMILPSGSGIFERKKDKFDYLPAGITGSDITQYIKSSEWNEYLKIWMPK